MTCLYDVYPYTEMSSSHTSFVQAVLLVSVFVWGGIFCIRWGPYNFFGKLLPTEFLPRCSMKRHVICASFKILKIFLTITMSELRMLEKLRLALKETYRCSTDKLPVLI